MKTCCFCWNVRNGTLATGIFNLVIKIIALITLIVVYSIHQVERGHYYVEGRIIRPRFTGGDAGVITAIIEIVLSIIFCALLLVGVKKGNKRLFWPWFILSGIEIVSGFIGICIYFIIWDTAGRAGMVGMGISTIFQVYCFYCVVAHFREVKQVTNQTQGKVIGVPYHKMPQDSEDPSVPQIFKGHSQPVPPQSFVDSSSPNPPAYDSATIEMQFKPQ